MEKELVQFAIAILEQAKYFFYNAIRWHSNLL